MSRGGDRAPLFERVALLGIGLIGSSLALALRRDNVAGHIAAYSRRAETRREAEALRLADSYHETPEAAATGAELVIFCTPLGAYDAIGRAIAPALQAGATVTDVGSVKQAVIRDLGPYIPEGVHFVPGHPIAGTEKSGPAAGFAELFDGRWTILTPPPGTDAAACEAISRMWQRCGAKVDILDAGHHDRVLAMTSHLPHLIAYTIVATASDLEKSVQSEVAKYSAGGFRDFTRIAASDPVMWRDIFLNNREAVLEVLQRFNEDLTALQRSIRWGEGERLHDVFRNTRKIRAQVLAEHQAGTFDPREPEAARIVPPDPDKDAPPEE